MSNDDTNGVASSRTVRLPSTPSAIAEARHAALNAVAHLRPRDEDRHRLALLTSELATNAVQASTAPEFDLDITCDGTTVTLSVTNRAGTVEIPDRSEWSADHALARRGRGLGIVDHLADQVRVTIDDDQVTVTATLKIDVSC